MQEAGLAAYSGLGLGLVPPPSEPKRPQKRKDQTMGFLESPLNRACEPECRILVSKWSLRTRFPSGCGSSSYGAHTFVPSRLFGSTMLGGLSK